MLQMYFSFILIFNFIVILLTNIYLYSLGFKTVITPKSLKIETRLYDIFVYEKNGGESSKKEKVESMTLVKLFLKFLENNQIKTPGI